MELCDFFRQHPTGAVAFSGGVDSSLLVWAAARYGKGWRAYYVHSPFQPAFDCSAPVSLLADFLNTAATTKPVR